LSGELISAEDDFPDAIKTKSLVEELKHLRFFKLNSYIKGLKETESVCILHHLTDYEINMYRPMLTEAFSKIAEFTSTQ